MYHLDFDHLIEIDDASFEDFIISSTNLTFRLKDDNDDNKNITDNYNDDDDDDDDILLRIRFSNCNFKFSPQRKPFQGLKAQEVHMNNVRNEYLANSVFDSSIISELHLENSLNFNGFLDLSDTLPNGNTFFIKILK